MLSTLRPALAALLLSAAPALAGDIGIHEPYALATPGSTLGTAYMVIHNHGTEDDVLLGATSPEAPQVDLHESVDENGVMRMRSVEGGIEIPAGGELDMTRGGLHLMFTGLAEPWADGKIIELTLQFERAGEMTFRVPVDMSRFADPDGEGESGHDHAIPMEGMGD